MRPSPSLLSSLAIAATLSSPDPSAAQISLGAHATIVDVRGATWGGGARAAVRLNSLSGTEIYLEGLGEYLSPSCDQNDCSVWAFHANVLARRSVRQITEPYLGIGVVYEDYALESGATELRGTDWGFNILAGTLAGNPGGARPFVEVRLSLMADLQSQAGASFGFRIPIA